MKVTLEPTTKTITVDGVPARIWEGTTDNGIEIHAFITRIRVPIDADQTAFELNLQECRAPSPDVDAIPNRLVL